MNKKLETINILAGELLNRLRRFPLSLLCAYLFTIILLILSTLNNSQKELLLNYATLNKVALIASIGFFLFTTLRLISRNYFLIVLGFILLIAYYIYLPDNIHNLNKLGVEYPLIIFSILSLMITAPYLNQSTSNIRFWNWAKHIIFSLLLTAIFGFILFIGLNGGLYIVGKLFILQQTSQYIEQIYLLTLGVFGSYFFLSQLPKYPRLLKVEPYNNIENIFTKFILTPLFGLYFIILYAYTAQIVFLGEWPKGVVSLSILLFSGLSILTYFFWTPLWNRENQKYKNFFWWAILIQTFVLAIAIYLRVESYGWTSNRYIIAIIGFWLFAISLYFIINKKASYRTIFISLPTLLMLTLFSPFSANSIAQKSQQSKLMNLLLEKDNLSQEANLSLRYNISSTIDYLYNEHSLDSLFFIMPEIVSSFQNQDENIDNSNCTTINNKSFPSYATEKLGFKYIDKWQWEQHTQTFDNEFENLEIAKIFTRIPNYEQETDLEIKGYEWLISFKYSNQNNYFPRYCPNPKENRVTSKPKYTIETSEENIIIKEKNTVLATVYLKKFINKIINTKKDKSIEEYYSPTRFSKEEFTYSFENQNIMIKIIFDTIEASEKDKIVHYRGNILLNKK